MWKSSFPQSIISYLESNNARVNWVLSLSRSLFICNAIISYCKIMMGVVQMCQVHLVLLFCRSSREKNPQFQNRNFDLKPERVHRIHQIIEARFKKRKERISEKDKCTWPESFAYRRKHKQRNKMTTIYKQTDQMRNPFLLVVVVNILFHSHFTSNDVWFVLHRIACSI